MSFTDYLPFASSVVMAFFVVMVFKRYFAKNGRASHLLLWGIGLTLYWIGSITEALHAAFGWNAVVFRLWYLCGAVLVAAWIGQGTVELLVRRRIGSIRVSHILLAILLIGSIYATYKVATATLSPAMIADKVNSVTSESGFDQNTVLADAAGVLESSALGSDGQVSDRRLSPLAQAVLSEASTSGIDIPQAETSADPRLPTSAVINGNTVELAGNDQALQVTVDGKPAGILNLEIGREMHGHAIVSGGTRVLTPFFNMYGLLTLVSGALYSAWIFLRKRIMPNRVLGNVLIASGALMPGIGGLLNRLGMGGYLYVGELLGAILMFAGFVAATKVPEAATVSKDVKQSTVPASGR